MSLSWGKSLLDMKTTYVRGIYYTLLFATSTVYPINRGLFKVAANTVLIDAKNAHAPAKYESDRP